MTSSTDLVLEQARELIEDRRRELVEGITPRALAARLEEHKRDSEKKHEALDARIRAVEQRGAATEAVTGRFHLVPERALPTIAPGRAESKRPSIGPWLKVVARSPIAHWLGVVAIVALSHLFARCGISVPSTPPAAAPGH